MNRKLIVILLILFILAGGLVGLYMVRSKQSGTPQTFWGFFFGGSQPPTNNPPVTPNFPPDNTTGTTTSPVIPPVSLLEKPGLTLLANGFASGAAFTQKGDIHYATRDTGNLYTFNVASGTTARYSNITVPASYATQFSTKGDVALLSSNERGVVKHTLLTTVASTANESTLPDALHSPALSPDGTRIAYREDGVDGAKIRVRTLSGKVADATIYTSVLQDIVVSWVNPSLLLVSTKASYKKDAVAMLITLSGGITELSLPLRGLTALPSPSNNRSLISHISADGELILSAFKKGENTTLPIHTFSEKCTWSKVSIDVVYCAVPTAINSQQLPDAWWKGDVSFTDEIWKLDLKEGSATRIRENTNMDIVELSVSSKDELLLFRNKKNASLWAYNLVK